MATNVAYLNGNGEEHKRVSFGGEKQFVYDDGLIDDYSLNNHASKHNSSFTSLNAPPSKVTVTTENFEVPRPISPPAQLEELNYFIAASPILPSLLKKMENESTENPFRPDESLYHEVDPIVKAYRQRPFPPSPCSSPVPSLPLANGNHHNNNHSRHVEYNYTEYKEGYHNNDNNTSRHKTTPATTIFFNNSSPNNSSTTTTTVTKTSKQNGSRTASLAEGRTPHKTHGDATPLIYSFDDLPPPNKAELVHINEKKKKCCCCCLQ